MNFYEENIEAYLTGKLNASDKLAMEAGISNDPLLKSEVDLQSDIIESLKTHRKIQLKNRLNNINVTASSSTGVSSAVKIAASLITVGMIGAGVYYMSVFSGQDKETDSVSVVINDNIIVPQLKTDEIKVEKGNEVVVTQIVENETTTTKGNATTSKSKNDLLAKDAPQANVPSGIIADTESDRANRDLTINVPTGEIGESNVGKTDKVDVTVQDRNKKDFSYQHFNNKLFLYGDFNEQPYNLVEINSPKSKQLYMYFDGKYYELKSNQTKVTRLKEVKDASILKHLNK